MEKRCLVNCVADLEYIQAQLVRIRLRLQHYLRDLEQNTGCGAASPSEMPSTTGNMYTMSLEPSDHQRSPKTP